MYQFNFYFHFSHRFSKAPLCDNAGPAGQSNEIPNGVSNEVRILCEFASIGILWIESTNQIHKYYFVL